MFRKWEVSLFCALLLTVLLASFGTFGADCGAVRADTLRRHIRANSDTDADQQLKLTVRDGVLQQFGAIFSTAQNKASATALAKEQLGAVQEAAAEIVAAAGKSYSVHASVQHMYFDTTVYDGFTLPAGYYDAVRIDLGEAKGHNWFCVMYPPLCLPAAVNDDALAGYTSAEKSVVQSPYKLKFALVEWLEKLKK